MSDYILLNECKDQHLYLIKARNSQLGVFKKAASSFIISRFKFKSNFLFEEDHWDTGEPFGTVQPIKLLKPTNLFMLSEKEQLDFLNQMALVYKDEIAALSCK
jgi:hypothetical protein